MVVRIDPETVQCARTTPWVGETTAGSGEPQRTERDEAGPLRQPRSPRQDDMEHPPRSGRKTKSMSVAGDHAVTLRLSFAEPRPHKKKSHRL